MIGTITAVLFVSLVGAATPAGQEPTKASLRDDPGVESALRLVATWLDAERAYKQVPGLSVGIVHDQNIVWSHGFGFADRERRVEATAKTIYSICSIFKLFTSIAVMQIRDQGRLDLGDSPNQHLPWFDIDQTYPDHAPITIRGMLTHSSGLPRESDFPDWSGPDFEFPSREQVIERVGRQQTLYPGDTCFQYSNLGVTLAGMIVAEVSGQPYDAYVTKHILDPLGLSDTRPELPRALWGERLATGYGALERDGQRKKLPFFQARGIAPAAGFSSTVDDLAAFASWQFRLLEHGGEEVLHANTLREMHRVHWLDPDWKGGLAMLSLPSNDPLEALQELRQTEGHRFRRVRDDGELAEEVVFELDADGAVTGFRQNSNVRSKID